MGNTTKFNLTGFIISLVVVSMLAAMFGLFYGELANQYSLQSSDPFYQYDNGSQLTNLTAQLNDATNIGQKSGFVDIIGGYFSSGWAALKISFNSLSVFNGMVDAASKDIPFLAWLFGYIRSIILIALIVGVLLAVLLKWRP